MSKVTVTVIAGLTLALGLTRFGLHRQIATNGKLESRVTELTAEVAKEKREVEYRDGLATVLDKITMGLTQSREVNAAALAKTTKAIRDIKPTEKDSHESINCLRTPVPVELDRLLRGATQN